MKSFAVHTPSNDSTASTEKYQTRKFSQRLLTSVIAAALCMGLLLLATEVVPARYTHGPRFAITVAMTKAGNLASDYKPMATRYMNNVIDFFEGLNLRAMKIPSQVAELIGSRSGTTR